MSLEINAQFNKFLEFAQSQANAASSKAVARIVEGEKGEKAPLAGRNITVANGDQAYRLRRDLSFLVDRQFLALFCGFCGNQPLPKLGEWWYNLCNLWQCGV